MGVSQTRRDELLNTMDNRYDSLTQEEKSDIAFMRTPEPQWLKLMRSIRKQTRDINNEKRLHLPMLESNSVIQFLNKIYGRVNELIDEDNLVHKTDIDFDGGQSDSYKRETKLDFINTLLSYIQDRKILSNSNFQDQYSPLSDFTLEELYNFLLEVSKRSEDEIKEFILWEIPSFPWDKVFGTSRKAA